MACSMDRSVDGTVCVAARAAAHASRRARRLAWRPGSRRRLTRRLLHRYDQVRNTLPHVPAKVDVGQSPELLVLVGLTICRTYPRTV